MPAFDPDTFLTEWETAFMASIEAWEGELTPAPLPGFTDLIKHLPEMRAIASSVAAAREAGCRTRQHPVHGTARPDGRGDGRQ
jgi:hypothetical protein